MNLVLLETGELDGDRAVVGGRRARHIATVHRAEAGRRLRVGVLGGRTGSAVVESVTPGEVVFGGVVLDAEPAPALPGTLVLALPRPLVLRRVLAAVTAFGLKRVVLLASLRVEKSYWQSPLLGDDAIRDALVEGLEQGGDTVLPLVEQRRRFRPFVEDELPSIARGTTALVAHPEGASDCPRAVRGAVTLVVGPEGGFVDPEIEMLKAAGVVPVTLGRRPLRVEQAVSVLLGRVF